MNRSEYQKLIEIELDKLPTDYCAKLKGDNLWIKCPFHAMGDILENTPSLSISLHNSKFNPGVFRCFSCDEKGSWPKLANKLNLNQFSNQSELYVDSTHYKITDKDKMHWFGASKSKTNSNAIPWNSNENWRTISGKLLSRLGCKLIYNEKLEDTQLYIPVNVLGEEIGHINATIEKIYKSQLSYVNSPGDWVLKSLFPYDYVSKMSFSKQAILLVEGPRDALNMIQHGIPALAIIGSQNWSESCKNLVLMLNPKLIILAFDPDPAGDRATEVVNKSLKNYVKCIRLPFEEGRDPGDLKKDEVITLKNKIYK